MSEKKKLKNKSQKTKKVVSKKEETLDPNKMYKMTCTGKHKNLFKGREISVNGSSAMIFLRQDYATLVK